LRRLGNKGRPFYRVVVTESTSGRNGKFVETIGAYNPVAQPKELRIDEARALHWLMSGAEPTETAAYLLNKVGVLGQYLEARPNQRKKYKFLDKRTAAISAPTAVDEPTAPPEEAALPTPEVSEAEVAPVSA